MSYFDDLIIFSCFCLSTWWSTILLLRYIRRYYNISCGNNLTTVGFDCPSLGIKLFPCWWAYNIKSHLESSIDRYKTRLVTNNFTQVWDWLLFHILLSCYAKLLLNYFACCHEFDQCCEYCIYLWLANPLIWSNLSVCCSWGSLIIFSKLLSKLAFTIAPNITLFLLDALHMALLS